MTTTLTTGTAAIAARLREGGATVKDLARVTGINESRTRRLVRSMERLGTVTTKMRRRSESIRSGVFHSTGAARVIKYLWVEEGRP
jgi:DNA-binding IclR family transcriptional regulator